MEKVTVMVLLDGEDKYINTYFPNELAALYTSHDIPAWVMPSYLMEQNI